MPKSKYTLSKKHQYLIEKLVDIPDAEDVKGNFFRFLARMWLQIIVTTRRTPYCLSSKI